MNLKIIELKSNCVNFIDIRYQKKYEKIVW